MGQQGKGDLWRRQSTSVFRKEDRPGQIERRSHQLRAATGRTIWTDWPFSFLLWSHTRTVREKMKFHFFFAFLSSHLKDGKLKKIMKRCGCWWWNRSKDFGGRPLQPFAITWFSACPTKRIAASHCNRSPFVLLSSSSFSSSRTARMLNVMHLIHRQSLSIYRPNKNDDERWMSYSNDLDSSSSLILISNCKRIMKPHFAPKLVKRKRLINSIVFVDRSIHFVSFNRAANVWQLTFESNDRQGRPSSFVFQLFSFSFSFFHSFIPSFFLYVAHFTVKRNNRVSTRRQKKEKVGKEKWTWTLKSNTKHCKHRSHLT